MTAGKRASLAACAVVGEFSEAGRENVFRISPPFREAFGIKEASMPGIHDVTAIAGDPVKNLSFYNRKVHAGVR